MSLIYEMGLQKITLGKTFSGIVCQKYIMIL